MPVPSNVSGRAKIAGGVLLMLGLWGALVPFIGPSFGYGMGGVAAWTWTESHATLHLAPGVAAIVGTLFLLRGRRAGQTFGSLLAMTGGIWFVIAPSLHPLWAGQGMAGMSGMSGMVSLRRPVRSCDRVSLRNRCTDRDRCRLHLRSSRTRTKCACR